MKITQNPNPILNKKTAKVEKIDSEVLGVINKMKNTLSEVPGVALAAPQIGISKQIVVTGYKPKKEDDIEVPEMVLINPEIIEKSSMVEELEEGCLSVQKPEIRGQVKRAKKIKVRALNKKGDKIEIKASNFLARVLQHEIDHLNGKLFLDRADPTTLYKLEDRNNIKKGNTNTE